MNLTDPESRIMKTADGFEQAYNAQAVVDNGSHLIVAAHVSDVVFGDEFDGAGLLAGSLGGRSRWSMAGGGWGCRGREGSVAARE